METLDSKSCCNTGTTVKRNYSQRHHHHHHHHHHPPPKKQPGSEKKVFSKYEYKKERKRGTHGRIEKSNHKERVTNKQECIVER